VVCMTTRTWQFSIDVGGTFTDVVALTPLGLRRTYKLLSSAVHRGVVNEGSSANQIVDVARRGEPNDFWRGYAIRTLGGADSRLVGKSDAATGGLDLESPLSVPPRPGDPYELISPKEAPVAAIRYLMGLRLDEPIGPVEVRLGTTRATNALLERKGARTLFITTKGFADVLRIGYQDRPRLFDLRIRKRDELFEDVLEIDERLSARGEILRAPHVETIRRELESFRRRGIEAAAICLLHAHVNADHEKVVAAVAQAVGFAQISISSCIAPLERIVPRGDTTVADAYLGRVIGDYVESLCRNLPQARILLMTSNGGLVPADRVHGKDTILSGPAGGVVGCAAVARNAGFPKSIGFDMGGTSTDVCRIDGPFEYQNETVKAGVRIMTPMLAVETVAAGGGSICAFDGQKLTVGPESAGADPGPACYGRGGPLTVTDMNVFLGRIVPSMFPFPLDRSRVEKKLTELAEQMQKETGWSRSSTELAAGFVEIANEHMAAAIKRISIAKGYDLRDYVLVGFGGAAGQHACAVACKLDITRILISPLAGVLSAFGIRESSIKRIAQRSIHLPLTDDSGSQIHAALRAVVSEASQMLAADGISANESIIHSRSVDVCYAGQSTLLTIPAADISTMRADFEERHRQLYGYIHANRAMEVRVVRAEVIASPEAGELDDEVAREGSESVLPFGGSDSRNHAEDRHHALRIDGTWRTVPLIRSDSWPIHGTVKGPAVVAADDHTNVIDDGWSAVRLPSGDLVLTNLQSKSLPAQSETGADPVRLELFHNQFASIAERMGATLQRTALSVNVKERLDFSCAVFDGDGGLVANAPHIPVHLGGMSDCIRCLREDVPVFEPGNVYITNDPFRGGSHLNDITVVTPVHDETGRRILFFVANRAHHAEIGGTRPGSMPPDSTCLADEGVLIRAFPIVRGGRFDEFGIRRILSNAPFPSRAVEENLADLTAQVAANQTGVRELQSLVAQHGIDVVHAFMAHIQRATESRTRRALARFPAGTRRFEDRLDDGTPLHVSIKLSGGAVDFDFSGSGPVHPGNLNANRSIVTSAIIYCLRCLMEDDIPLNAGILASVEINLPVGLLNPPAHADPRLCPAIVGGNVETSQRVVDVIFGALGLVAASQGTMNNVLLGNDRFGYYETICGGAGAGPEFNGADAVHTHMTNTRLTDPEVLESRYPVRLLRFGIRHGSGGRGRFQGGCGVIREFEFLEPLELSILSQRRLTAPCGLAGGSSGAPGRNVLYRIATDSQEILPPIAYARVNTGDRLTLETPGGGGYDQP